MFPDRRLQCAAILALVACAAACSRAKADPAREPTGSGPAAGRPPVAVDLSPVATGDVIQAVDVVGSLAPKFEAEVKSEHSGIVTDVYVTEWVRVRKGTPLARLDTREVAPLLEAAKATVLQAEVAEARAVREADRATNLKEFGLATQQQLDDARSAREAAAAATAAARAQRRAVETRMDKSLIRSPIDGIVAFRGVNIGDRVENMGGNAAMFRIVDTRVLQANVTVPSAHLAALKVGQPFRFEVDGLPGRTFDGRLEFINPTVDPVTRGARVLVDVPNPREDLKGGLFVRGRIETGTRTGVLRVPRSALVNWDMAARTADVFVVDNGVAARRRITTGLAGADEVEVASGLETSDRVVSRGAFNLREGDRVSVAGPSGA